MDSYFRLSCDDIDICMIVYNESEIIERSISALLNAGFLNFVILDMNSTDNTVAKILKLCGSKAQIISYPRSSLLKYGYAETRNVCASFATRDWILFVDADEVLTHGCDNGILEIPGSVPPHSDLLSIERNNLSPPSEVEGGIPGVKSVEHHNRLYKHSLDKRWAGFIHEEIFVSGSSGWRSGGESGLIFDHYSYFKSSVDNNEKNRFYAFMLLRGYQNQTFRFGTNDWWYNHHVPENIEYLKRRATEFTTKHSITLPFAHMADSSFVQDLQERKMHEGSADNEPLPSIFAHDDRPDSVELTFEIGTLRRLHAVSSFEWTKLPSHAVWGEWNHPGEGSRSFTSIINGLKASHWPKFIKPGMVAIDIGAHSGDTAIPMALFGYDPISHTRGNVIAVEPNPAVCPVLDINLALNSHIGNFRTVRAAITKDDIDEIELADHGNAECNGGVLDGGFSENLKDRLHNIAQNKYKTRGISMATLYKNSNAAFPGLPVGFIKIDCEGYDKEIIRPCKELFEKTKPVLFIEWFAWFTVEDDLDLFAVIDSIDYVPLNPANLQRANVENRIPDLLCFHKSDAAAYP